MTDYTELLELLRYCSSKSGCIGCKLSEAYDCTADLTRDAAAAIEALETEIRESMQKCAECGDANMPKRGEWIEHGEPPMLVVECSVCGQKYFNHVMQEKAKYCSMCGAKMEVQE